MSQTAVARTGTGRRRQRRGAALLMAIVCLMVMTALAVSLARSLVAQQRQLRLRGSQMQAFWLAESAVERARVRLDATPEYAGEDWHVELELRGAAVEARATIRVESVAGESSQRRIVVQARCPAEGDASVLEMRERTVTPEPAEGLP